MESLLEIIKSHKNLGVYKVDHYIDIYERYFSSYRNKEITILEIGVHQGGSLQVWKKYFGASARIYGVDIDDKCKQFEEDQISIYIGDQADPTFLEELIEALPPLDIILDDGGHTMVQQITTFDKLFPKLKFGGIYICEDCGTSYSQYYGGKLKSPSTFIEYMKNKVDDVNAWYSNDILHKPNRYTRSMRSVCFYSGMVVIEKERMTRPSLVNKSNSNLQTLGNPKHQENLKKAIQLIYEDRDFVQADKFIAENISKVSIELLLFKSRIFAETNQWGKSIKQGSYITRSNKIFNLFYLLDFPHDSVILDLANIGNMLRSKGDIEKSEKYLSAFLQAQLDKEIINRTTVVQRLIDASKTKLYLEIGVFVGHNFFQIEANKKVAVDPVPRMPFIDVIPSHIKYYKEASNDFFNQKMDPILEEKCDVIFIDGLHTYAQSLEDVINALNFIKDDGVIIMHDCYPRCKAAAHPVLEEAQKMEGYQGFWNGDVFKSILWLRSFRDDIEVFVLDTDHGLGVVTKRSPHNMLSLTEDDIATMTYSTFEENEKQYLNLKPKEYFDQWEQERL